MLVGLLGDLHHRVFLGLAVVLEWQRRAGRHFDLVVQVGDLGVPELDPNDPYASADDAERDFGRFLVGTSVGFRGDVHGSQSITRLIEPCNRALARRRPRPVVHGPHAPSARPPTGSTASLRRPASWRRSRAPPR